MAQVISSEIGAFEGSVAELQRTLGQPVSQSGVSLHLGVETRVRVLPAAANTGRVFIRTDLPGHPQIPANVQAVKQTQLSTELRTDTASVRTVEHLLAALTGLGIDNAYIEVDGPELPLLDGSAQPWVSELQGVSTQSQSIAAATITVTSPVWVREGEAFVVAMPAPEIRLTYGINFDLPAIGSQWYSWAPIEEGFAAAIAPARTFGLAHQIDYLRQQGLIKGGSLENALVCDRTGWLNPPLRFENEPVRHKLLDLVGDLGLLGRLPRAHIIAHKASHTLHVELARALSQLPTASS